MVINTTDDLKKEITTLAPTSFVSRYIFDSTPHCFNGELSSWIAWKHQLSDLIDVDARDIVLTGSAAIGFSLNPSKNFKAYDSNSDIDCGIVSEHHFNLSWRHLRKESVDISTKNPDIKRAIKDHKKHFVFQGTIAADRMLPILPFGKDWQAALDLMSTVPPTFGKDVKLRIYKDFDALRNYQAQNIVKLRDENILAPTDGDEQITTIESDDDK